MSTGVAPQDVVITRAQPLIARKLEEMNQESRTLAASVNESCRTAINLWLRLDHHMDAMVHGLTISFKVHAKIIQTAQRVI